MSYEDSLIVKAAWYYYMENMTQQEISQKLDVSRMKVIKLLDKAKQLGVIQFKICPEKGKDLFLEQKLIKRWALKDAFIVPTPPSDDNINETISQAAAMYINNRLTENIYINMGYGDTPNRVLNHLATIAESPISVISLTGGVSYYLPNIHSNTFKAKLYLYPAPLLVSSKEMCSAMLQEPPIQKISRMISLASLTVVGIGAMSNNATIITNGILNQSDFSYLSMKGAVGDVLTHFIDKDGNPVHSDIEDRLFSTPLETLKKLNNVIGVSGGSHKVEAIQAALKGGYIDILVTDENTAIQLCQE
ncbi:MAG: sugar-binding transcriptional regulator [Eubacteriales bacterium]|nr:sugar-binding transcriptional regulator [Eubacteriales bacterium]